MSLRHVRRLWLGVGLLALAASCARADNGFGVSTPAFQQGAVIPGKYAYHEQNVSPELQIKNVPANARSLMLIVDDPDSPAGRWTHWLVWNIAPGTTEMAQGRVPVDAVQGRNSFGNLRYDGPAPPTGTHRYYFRVSALDSALMLAAGTGRAALDQAAKGHVIAETEFYGTYSAGK